PREAFDGCRRIRLRYPAALSFALEPPRDAGDGRIHPFLLNVDERDIEPAVGGDLGNPAAHQTRTNNPYPSQPHGCPHLTGCPADSNAPCARPPSRFPALDCRHCKVGCNEGSGSMQIEWVNHASFVVRHEQVALISDPWLFGTAFDDGWSLLSPTRFRPEDFATLTHVWVSHEHPDHFHP